MATFTVTNTNDSGAGSLRQEILDANALSGKDIINFGGLFDDGLADTISLIGGGLSITDDIAIQGTNPNLLTISDNSASRVFDIASRVVNLPATHCCIRYRRIISSLPHVKCFACKH